MHSRRENTDPLASACGCVVSQSAASHDLIGQCRTAKRSLKTHHLSILEDDQAIAPKAPSSDEAVEPSKIERIATRLQRQDDRTAQQGREGSASKKTRSRMRWRSWIGPIGTDFIILESSVGLELAWGRWSLIIQPSKRRSYIIYPTANPKSIDTDVLRQY